MDEQNTPNLITHFAHKHCGEEWKFKDFYTDFFSLTFVVDGVVHYKIDDAAKVCKQGDIVFIKPGNRRTASTNGFTCVAIDFNFSGSNPLNSYDLNFKLLNYPSFTSWGSFAEFAPYFKEFKYEWLQKNNGYTLKCYGLLMLILHKILYNEKRQNKHPYVEEIKSYIIQNYATHITVNSIASHFGFNPVYIGHVFKKHENKTILQFLRQVRIHASLELLARGLPQNLTISQIAEEVGFTDVYHFSNVFKQLMGVSPKKYMLQNM
ncbi:AraC family transcriptional regulator [Xylanibacillus composti]|uniref:HTH araC/xylS-type domain-containing protein n=1 Tax=Xylanibacillus composti TaxID=1572762 RepID=A0A8J4H5X5_9BACL|nr:AraC family transcriptional regulator [Xylanibacillus composti]MDT9727234.1 AraC family transcriptional regulator [Xylanibacillus composti]GIQ71552.1 hypothetical protein XYCOK13_43760 [Xylanibacillus composti]